MTTRHRLAYPKTYLPHHLPFGRLAFVPLIQGKPVASVYQRLSATQVVGGKTWSLAIMHINLHQRTGEDSR